MKSYRKHRIILQIWTVWFLKTFHNCPLYVIFLMIISLKIRKEKIYHIANVYYFLKVSEKI